MLAQRKMGASGAAFTLVEVLVALVILSVMTLLAWRGVGAMQQSVTVTAQSAQETHRLEATLAQWRADLDAHTLTRASKAIDFDGLRMVVTRRAAAPDVGLWVVAWKLTEGQLARWVSPLLQTQTQVSQAWAEANRWSRTPLAQDEARVTRLIPAERWQVFYFRQDAWSNPMSSSGAAAGAGGTSAAGDATDPMPDGVRLVLTLPLASTLAGNLTLDWVHPALGATR